MKVDPLTRKHRTLYLAISMALTMTPLGPGAWAQPEETIALPKLEVTGSHIKRTEYEGAFPIAVLDQEYIERSGASTVAELVKKVIYNGAGVVDETFTTEHATASASFDLRGLGVNRTLVLVNGRRTPLFPFARDGSASFVDINLIPLGAVERIEILKDGASAIYGSDAIAGVVNIILRQDYEGAELSLQVGGAGKGDGKEGQLTATGGISNEKGNFTFIADYFNRDAVMAKDRDLTKSAIGTFDNRSAVGDPGTVINLDNGAFGPDPRCPSSSINPEKGPFCWYDFPVWNTLIPETQRLGLVASGDYELRTELSVFFGANYTHSKSERDLAPASIQSDQIFFVDPGNPNNIFNAPVLSIYRPTELGPRTNEFETEAWNLVAGLRGSIDTWDWELGVGGGEIRTKDRGTNGFATWEDIQGAIDSGALNPFGPSPDFDPASIHYETRRDGESSLFYTDLKATGEVMEMKHGVLSAAVGAEFRSEHFSNDIDPITGNGEVVGAFQGASGEGDRDVWALYAELNVPLLSNLEIDLAGRYDDYNDFGGTFNPKLGLRWKPMDNLLFRGSAGTGFKAPSLPELYTGVIGDGDTVIDPVTGEVVQVTTLTTGNPDLDPEESKSYGLGFVWDVTNVWSLTLDWWRTNIENGVSREPQFYVDNEAQFPDNIERNDNGVIEVVHNPFRNIAERKVWGIDFGTEIGWATQNAGDFSLNVASTYLGSFKETPLPGAESVDVAGRDGRPRWRGQASLTWNKSDYETALIVNYVGGYDRDTETTERYHVDSWTTVDAKFNWSPRAINGGTVSVGIDNLFDQEPPEEQFWSEGWPWYNQALYNARGRFFYAQYKHEFK